MHKVLFKVGAAVAVAALTVAGCGSSDDSKDDDTATADSKLVDMLPDDITSAGTIKVGSSLAVPPLYFPGDDGKPTGVLIDIIEEVADHLGLDVTWSQVATGAQPVALTSGKIDMSGSQFDPTPEVLETGIVVTTYNTSTGLVVKAGNPKGISEMTDLCGLTLAVGRGAFTDLAASETVKLRCKEAGRPEPSVKMFDGAGESQTAVRSGRVDGYFVASSVSNYSARTAPDQFDSVLEGGFENVHQGGLLFSKDNTELAKAVQAALDAMIEDGSYDKILQKWKLEQMKIEKSEYKTAS